MHVRLQKSSRCIGSNLVVIKIKSHPCRMQVYSASATLSALTWRPAGPVHPAGHPSCAAGRSCEITQRQTSVQRSQQDLHAQALMKQSTTLLHRWNSHQLSLTPEGGG